MSKESTNSHSRIDYIQAQIEALKRQRGRFERLIVILRAEQQLLDQWTVQYFAFLEMKRALGLKLISLPKDEMESLKEILGSETLEEYENFVNESLSELLLERRILTIAEMETVLAKIDELIVELIVYNQRIVQGEKEAIRHTKDLVLKKVVPIFVGLALIGVDITLKNWPTIISGGYIIYATSVA